MINCKVLIPFVNSDNGIALNVNDIIELKEERAKELENKGLVEITTNPLTSNKPSDPQTPDDGNTGEPQTNNNDDVPPVNNDGDNNPTNNDDGDPQTPDDGNNGESQTNKNKKSNKK